MVAALLETRDSLTLAEFSWGKKVSGLDVWFVDLSTERRLYGPLSLGGALFHQETSAWEKTSGSLFFVLGSRKHSLLLSPWATDSIREISYRSLFQGHSWSILVSLSLIEDRTSDVGYRYKFLILKRL